MPSRESLLLEIETAKVRHSWAKAEYKRNPSSVALARYVDETLNEWIGLKAGRERGRPKISN
jgi:hypothetical protein